LTPVLSNLSTFFLSAASSGRKLQDALAPSALNIINDSHKHAGHAGNPGGEPDAETHFRIEVSDAPLTSTFIASDALLIVSKQHSAVLGIFAHRTACANRYVF
jgi:hypothetical protein